MFYCYGFAATSQLPVVPAGYLPLEGRVIAPDSGTDLPPVNSASLN